LYRHAVARTLQRSEVFDAWTDARSRDASTEDGSTWTLHTCIEEITSEIVGPFLQGSARRAVALCFAQQAVAAESPAWPPWSRTQFIDGLVALADADLAPPEDVAEHLPSLATTQTYQEMQS
jgi:hypothetical protein